MKLSISKFRKEYILEVYFKDFIMMLGEEFINIIVVNKLNIPFNKTPMVTENKLAFYNFKSGGEMCNHKFYLTGSCRWNPEKGLEHTK